MPATDLARDLLLCKQHARSRVGTHLAIMQTPCQSPTGMDLATMQIPCQPAGWHESCTPASPVPGLSLYFRPGGGWIPPMPMPRAIREGSGLAKNFRNALKVLAGQGVSPRYRPTWGARIEPPHPPSMVEAPGRRGRMIYNLFTIFGELGVRQTCNTTSSPMPSPMRAHAQPTTEREDEGTGRGVWGSGGLKRKPNQRIAPRGASGWAVNPEPP